jgi:hypothetical protein
MTSVRFVQRFTPSGISFGVYEDSTMPRIADQFLDCAAYLYGTKGDAQMGMESGGSGFLIRMKSAAYPDDLWHRYVVTCKHVVEGKDGVVRLNNKDGGFETLPLRENDWVLSTTEDLAIALVELPSDRFRYRAVSTEFFITKGIIEDERIGPGDETFLVGRFVNHEGRQCNLPSVRCGNIAVMADGKEPVLLSHKPRKTQEAFLVEQRTKCGFSGSPVFVQISHLGVEQLRGGYPALDEEPLSGHGPWLLGVHVGQVEDTRKEAIKKGETNTGMGIVIPAWHLQFLLDDGRSVSRRIVAEGRFASIRMADPAKLESATGKRAKVQFKKGI